MGTHTPLHLTPRDFAVLEWIGQAGVASLDQIARGQWQGHQRPARARLHALCQVGYLHSHYSRVRGFNEQIYSLCAPGGQLIATHEPVIGLPGNHLLAQQLRLQEVYLWLDARLQAGGSTLTAWQTEYALQYQLRHGQRLTKGQRSTVEIPDGRVLFTDAAGQAQQLAIEIDGHYYGQHLQAKLTTYGRQSLPVLWVCPRWRLPTIAPALRDYPHLSILILEDTPDARPYCVPTEPAGVIGGLPGLDH